MHEYLKNAIENITEYRHKRTDCIYIMGRLGHSVIIKDILEDMGFPVAGYIDNDTKKQGLTVEGLLIESPDKILGRYNEDIIVFIYSPKYSMEMALQCERYGYKEGRQVFVVDKPSYERNVQLIKLGMETYQRLQEKYGKDVKLFYADCPRGDFYLLSLFAEQFCNRCHIDNKVIVSHSRGLDDLAKILGMIPYESLSVLESRALTTAWCFLGDDVINLLPMTIWQGEFRFNPCLIRQRTGMTFVDTFRYLIFGLEEGAIPKFTDFSDKDFDAEKYCKDRGLEKDKSILISPFSYSLQSLSEDKWNAIADLLSEKGYRLAVNTGKDTEENFIRGTISVNLDFSRIVKVMEYIGNVVGMRSGFFDITCKAKCKRIILYPPKSEKMTVWNSTDISFCSLKNMGLCEDAVEIEINDIESVMRQIDSIIPKIG